MPHSPTSWLGMNSDVFELLKNEHALGFYRDYIGLIVGKMENEMETIIS